MFRSLKKQQGMTGIGVLMIVFLICFFSFITIKIVPVYLDNYSVKSIVKALKEEPNIAKKSTNAVRTMIMKRLRINGILDLKKENIKVKKFAGKLDVSIEYQIRRPLFGNLDVLISFKDAMQVASH